MTNLYLKFIDESEATALEAFAVTPTLPVRVWG
jgi:hypothetical protein